MLDTTITITFPAAVMKHLQTVAHSQNLPIAQVVQDLVTKDLPTLPPLPPDVESELAAFSKLSDDVLLLLAKSTLSLNQQQELAALNDEAQRRSLTQIEQKKQQELIDQYDRMLIRRAKAASLLQMRGYDLVKLDILPKSSPH